MQCVVSARCNTYRILVEQFLLAITLLPEYVPGSDHFAVQHEFALFSHVSKGVCLWHCGFPLSIKHMIHRAHI